MHVLIVEDDSSIREMVATYLSRVGFQTSQAQDGVDALLQTSKVRPDLILMDLGLPRLNGWQTIKRLRSRADTAHIPIIALTAYALDSERQSALDIGCDEFETKPIDFDSLVSKIRELIERARA